MKDLLKKSMYLVAGLIMFVSQISYCQTYLEDVSGKPIRIGQYVDVEGSPYVQDEWSTGEVKLANGDVFKNIDLKYDIASDVLLFKSKQGEAQEFVHPVNQFMIGLSGKSGVEHKLFKNGYPKHDNLTEQNFYEILYEGKVSLLKRRTKVIHDEKLYNSATITKKFLSNEMLYIYKGGTFTKVKKDQKSLLSALNDRAGELKTFIGTNKLNLKEEKDLVKLLAFYDSLL